MTFPRGTQLSPARARSWLASDPATLARVGGSAPPKPVVGSSVASLLQPWRRRLVRRRIVVAVHRSLIVGLSVVVLLEVLELALGLSRASQIGSVALALAVAALLAVLTLRSRTTAVDAARILDRDLRLADEIATAVELEGAAATGLAALVRARAVEDLIAASGRRLGRIGRRGDWLGTVVLAAAVATAIAVPRVGGTSARTTAVRALHGAVTPGRDAGSVLHVASPPLTLPRTTTRPDVRAVTPAGGGQGALSGHSPYGGGIASKHPVGDIGPTPHALPAGRTGRSPGVSSAGAGAAEGQRVATGNGKSGATSGAASAAGADAVVRALEPTGDAGAGGGTVATRAGSVRGGTPSRGGGGAGASAGRSGAASGMAGGASAGSGAGGKNRSAGLVPALGFAGGLPLQPGFAPVAGVGRKSEQTGAAAGGTGGVPRSEGVAGAGGTGAGAVFVPPAAGALGVADRALILGFFTSSALPATARW